LVTLNILFVGESCFAQTFEFKGYNQFSGVQYHEGAPRVRAALEAFGHRFTHIPCHLVARDFPREMERLQEYDVILFSDVGSDTFLLLPDMVRGGVRRPNLLKLVREYVLEGGGFGMIGGYMSFQGTGGSARYASTPIEEILPVSLLPYDDRVEVPDGADLRCEGGSHPLLEGLPDEWPYILGYNRLRAKPGARVLVSFEGDPILAVGEYGAGRTAAFASDCGPHWAPAPFHTWEHYPALWNNFCLWLAGKT
jgi:uncharacterized membrane protein